MGLAELVFQPLALGDIAANAQDAGDPAGFQKGRDGEFADGIVAVLLSQARLIDRQRFASKTAVKHVRGQRLVVRMHERSEGLAQPIGHRPGRNGFKRRANGRKRSIRRQRVDDVPGRFHQ